MEELNQHKKALGTHGNQRGSKHGKAAQESTPGITHRLIRRTELKSVGSTDEQSRQQKKQAPVDPTH